MRDMDQKISCFNLYASIEGFTEKETILNLQLLKSKIEKLTWVDSVITVIDVPLIKKYR